MLYLQNTKSPLAFSVLFFKLNTSETLVFISRITGRSLEFSLEIVFWVLLPCHPLLRFLFKQFQFLDVTDTWITRHDLVCTVCLLPHQFPLEISTCLCPVRVWVQNLVDLQQDAGKNDYTMACIYNLSKHAFYIQQQLMFLSFFLYIEDIAPILLMLISNLCRASLVCLAVLLKENLRETIWLPRFRYV